MTKRYTALDFQLAAHDAREAVASTSKRLYPKGQEPTPAPTVTPIRATPAAMAAAARHYDVPRCLECHGEVVINSDPHAWHCAKCLRGGWCETIAGRDVRIVDTKGAQHV